jgi:glutathione S-transferase
MPKLESEDGEVITESVAILLTLDERHPDAGLFPPPGSKDRAQALRWMVFMATEMYPLVEMVDYPDRFADSADAAEAIRRRAEEKSGGSAGACWRPMWPDRRTSSRAGFRPPTSTS